MAAEVVQSEPAIPEPSGSVAVAAFLKAQGEAGNEPTPEPGASAPAPAAPATSASIVIPIDRVPEKFRANPDAVFGAYENSERAFHTKAQEAAQLKRDNEALSSRLAAAEQVNRMQPRGEPQQPANLSEMVITETPRFVETIEQRAAAAAAGAAQRETQKFRDEIANERQGNALISTFERAKDMARKGGYEISDQEWPQYINYAARVIKDQTPERLLDPSAYIEHLQIMRGTPKATIPTEGNPPVASKSAPATPQKAAPTLTREEAQVKKRIWGALGLTE